MFVNVRRVSMLLPPVDIERNYNSSLTRRAYSWFDQRESKAVHRETPEKVSIAFLHWLQVCRVLLLILIELVYYYRTNREWIWYKSVKSQNWRYPSFFFGVQPALLQNKLSENGVQRAHAFETFELMARAFLILLWIEILWNSRNWKKYL